MVDIVKTIPGTMVDVAKTNDTMVGIVKRSDTMVDVVKKL